MSKLIGTNPNQVPSNADLGSAAFMDAKEFLTSRGSRLSAIDAIVPKTAVDVFVYDTSKDSDGGAWRKRTQHTSWYNEKLSTTTRGSRKDFPAVAVLVAEANKLTIYDGDDPSLPMWMVFDPYGYKFIWNYTTSVAALNSRILLGGGSNTGLHSIDFIEDTGYFWTSLTEKYSKVRGNIQQRSISETAFDLISSTAGIVNATVNDVAMTVLPNAQIDSATGLPVPTIAVATESGVSVIKDDGTVVDITSSSAGFGSVDFFDERLAYSYGEGGIVNQRVGILDSIPSADTSSNSSQYAGLLEPTLDPTNPKLLASAVTSGGATAQYVTHDADGFSVGVPYYVSNYLQRLGVTRVLHNSTGVSNSSVAYIASDYNTGWMHGDIKLATLSDTDTANAVGTELVTNGNFSSSDLSSFSAYNSGTLGASIAVVGGELKLTHTGTTNYAFATFSWAAEIGQVYRVSCDLKNGNASYAHFKPHSGCTWNPSDKTHSGTSYETTTHTVTAIATTAQIRLQLVGSNGQYAYFDNVSVTKAEHDRSYNNNALQVFGTVTKTAVATGADLVAYSGFSQSGGAYSSNVNYLHYPKTVALGTSDFHFALWLKFSTDGGQQTILSSMEADGQYAGPYLSTFTSGTVYMGMYLANQANAIQTPYQISDGAPNIADDKWHQVIFTKSGTNAKVYIDGEFTVESNSFYSTTATFDKMDIGSNYRAFNGSLALLRLSATVPSPDQIKKMYNDEKFLFQENAKATLYGTSDAVTALAYDDDTELLHAGTSAGRSDFQGLRRINNTTRAIGTAISAVDGFIVEE